MKKDLYKDAGFRVMLAGLNQSINAKRGSFDYAYTRLCTALLDDLDVEHKDDVIKATTALSMFCPSDRKWMTDFEKALLSAGMSNDQAQSFMHGMLGGVDVYNLDYKPMLEKPNQTSDDYIAHRAGLALGALVLEDYRTLYKGLDADESLDKDDLKREVAAAFGDESDVDKIIKMCFTPAYEGWLDPEYLSGKLSQMGYAPMLAFSIAAETCSVVRGGQDA